MNFRSAGRILTVVSLLLVQVLINGPGIVRSIPGILAIVLGAFWLLYSVRDRQLTQGNKDGLTVSASLYLDSLESTDYRVAADTAAKGMARVVGQGALGGYIDFSDKGIRWRPGPVSKLWRFKSFFVPWAEIKEVEAASMYPGLGRLAADLSLDLVSGGSLEFWTRNLERIQETVNAKQGMWGSGS